MTYQGLIFDFDGTIADTLLATLHIYNQLAEENDFRPVSKDAPAAAEQIMSAWRKRFADCPFVSPVDHLPATKHVTMTNRVQMTARAAGDRVILVCAIDNLAKGASGAAIQNMNVMFGLDESTGLN